MVRVMNGGSAAVPGATEIDLHDQTCLPGTHRQPDASHGSDQRDPVRRSVSLEHRGFISIDSSRPKYKFVRRLTDDDHQFVAGECLQQNGQSLVPIG